MRIPVKSKTSVCHKNFEENVLNCQKCLFYAFLVHFSLLFFWGDGGCVEWLCQIWDRWLLVNAGLSLLNSFSLPSWLTGVRKKRWERKDPWSQGVGKANYVLREAEGDKWKSSINAGCHYQSICSGWRIKSPTNLCVAGGRCTPTMADRLTYEERSLKQNP